MSSHREAPEISKDPVADSTDVYAFVSPDKPGTVTLIANYVPLQRPSGGPNFYEFGDDVLYEIHIDNNGDGRADITYQFRFQHHGGRPGHLPVQHRPDRVAQQPELEPPPVLRRHRGEAAPGHACWAAAWPARRATSGRCPRRALYAGMAAVGRHGLGGGISVFAGQRAEAFYVDLGSIFDLGDLRPFENLHATFGLPGLPSRRRVSTPPTT